MPKNTKKVVVLWTRINGVARIIGPADEG